MRVLTLVFSMAAGLAHAGAPEPIEYIPGLKKARFDNGETLLVKWRTEWSLTSARQEELLDELMAENPGYAEKLTFVTVDYDTYGKSRMAERLDVDAHGTLLIMRDGKVIGRLGPSISKHKLKALLDSVN